MVARCKPVSDRHRVGEPFGYLVTLDLYECAAGVCGDVTLCYDFLEALVHQLGMTMQAPPFLFRSPSQYPDKAGLSGWVPLIESGIQIHTLIPKRFIAVDIFCCHHFDSAGIEEMVRKVFDPVGVEMNEIVRGLKYNETV